MGRQAERRAGAGKCGNVELGGCVAAAGNAGTRIGGGGRQRGRRTKDRYDRAIKKYKNSGAGGGKFPN